MSGGKLWGLFQTKDVLLGNSENWANFFLEFSQYILLSLSKLLHFRRSEKNISENFLYFEKFHFLRSFPTFYQKFQDFPPIFFIRVVKLAFSMSRRTLPSKLDFLSKNFYFTRFPVSGRMTIGLSTIFFSVGTSKLRSRCPEHIPEEKIFEKKVLKFSIRFWGRFFEKPVENFAAVF